MAKPKKLKVFRTPIGFHDAFVAAPSQKAALEAWGSTSNLFAQGAAEIVTDPKLTKEPLANPGKVIKRLRGTEQEQIKAVGSRPAKAKRPAAANDQSEEEAPRRPSRRPPRPSRALVEKAEAALEKAEARHRQALEQLKREEQELDRKRRDLERKQREERKRLAQALDEARDRYSAALSEWAK